MRSRFRDLSLIYKLLIPSLVLVLLVGITGVFLIAGGVSQRARTALNEELSVRWVNARIFLSDRERYLLDSVRFAANLEGMANAVAAGDKEAVRRLADSVRTLQTDLNFLVITDRMGAGLVEIEGRDIATGDPPVSDGTDWSGTSFVGNVLNGLVDFLGDKWVGFIKVGGRDLFAVAGPIRTGPDAVAGAAIAGFRLDDLIQSATGIAFAEGPGEQAAGTTGLALFESTGGRLSAAGLLASPARPTSVGLSGSLIRYEERTGPEEAATLYRPFTVREQVAGTLAVSLPTAPVKASIRRTAIQFAALLGVAILAAVGIGYVITSGILAQTRKLLEANRDFGRGSLGSRAQVLGHDEMGELAQGFNQMAEELQSSYEELEQRVAQRTRELEKLYEEVRHSSQVRADFFAAMSHEFRTPLMVIGGHAEMLLDPDQRPSGAWKRDFGQTIKGSVGYLLRIVDDILSLARMEAGRLEIDLQEVSLAEVVAELRPTIDPLARQGGLGLSVHLDADLPQVRADPARLKDILLNLIANAVKYTEPGGKVVLSVAAAAGQVEVSVADTGLGIPPTERDSLFRPFHRVKGTRPVRGEPSSGLGLALTKGLVEAQGGEITFISTEGEGTTFTFTLPRANRRGQAKS